MSQIKEIIYIDLDGVLVDFQSGVNRCSEEDKIKANGRFDQIDGIFSTMDPIPGGIEAYKTLMKSGKYSVYFLSKPCHKNPSCYTDKRNWIAKHLGEYHAQFLILSPFKHLSIGDFLIDDRPVPGFVGKQLLFGSEEFPDWSHVLKFFFPVNKE